MEILCLQSQNYNSRRIEMTIQWLTENFQCRYCLLIQPFVHADIDGEHYAVVTIKECHDPKCKRYEHNGKETEFSM